MEPRSNLRDRSELLVGLSVCIDRMPLEHSMANSEGNAAWRRRRHLVLVIVLRQSKAKQEHVTDAGGQNLTTGTRKFEKSLPTAPGSRCVHELGTGKCHTGGRLGVICRRRRVGRIDTATPAEYSQPPSCALAGARWPGAWRSTSMLRNLASWRTLSAERKFESMQLVPVTYLVYGARRSPTPCRRVLPVIIVGLAADRRARSRV